MQIPGIHIYLVLWLAARAVRAHAERHIDSLGLIQSHFAVLEVLLHKGPLPVNKIGEKVLLTSGSITPAVDHLERLGLVERSLAGNDRRVRMVHLTTKGRELIEPAFADHIAVMERAVSSLSREERAILLDLLKKLGKSASALLQEVPAKVVERAVD